MKGVRLDLSPPSGPIRYRYSAAVHLDDFPELGMVGPMAGGKSTAAVDRLARRAVEYPGLNQLLGRDTLVNLKASTLVRFKQRLGAMFLPESGGSLNDQEGIYRFPPAPHPVTGVTVQSVVKAIGLDRVDLENVFKSTEYGGGHLEEADQISSDAHDIFQERSRQEFYHRSKTVRDMCMELANQWSRFAPKPLTWEDVYHILLADPLNRVGEHQFSADHPMPGDTTVSASWNPVGNDHTWARYVGVTYPFPAPSEQWVKDNIGIREVHIPPAILIEDLHRFRAGALVQLPDKSRAYVQSHDGGDEVVLVGGSKVPRTTTTLVKQRYCIYFFSHENMSRDHKNVENTYLMANQEMRRRHQFGHVDARVGRVMPAFVDEPLGNGGHVVPEVSIERISRAGNLIIAGLDHGGDHPTAALLAMYLPSTQSLIFFAEMVKSGQSAYANAVELQQLLVPLGCDFIIGYDPAMNARIFDKNADERMIDNYIEVIGDHFVEGARGDAAYDELAKMLEFQDDFTSNRPPMPRIMVTENCVQIRKTGVQLTWDMVARKRHMWQVDVGDAMKIAASVVKRGYAGGGSIDSQALTPRLARATSYAPR